MFNRGSQRDMTSLPVYTKDGSPRHPSSRSMAGSATAATAPQQHASQLLQQMSAGLWTLAAPLAPVAVLCAGIYVTSLEAGPGRPVDRQSCSCNCWDGRWVVAASEHSNPHTYSFLLQLLRLVMAPSLMELVQKQESRLRQSYISGIARTLNFHRVTHVVGKRCVTPAPLPSQTLYSGRHNPKPCAPPPPALPMFPKVERGKVLLTHLLCLPPPTNPTPSPCLPHQVQRPARTRHIRHTVQEHLLQPGASNSTAGRMGVHMAQPVGPMLAANPAAGTRRAA
jgi:hypothetical protein